MPVLHSFVGIMVFKSCGQRIVTSVGVRIYLPQPTPPIARSQWDGRGQPEKSDCTLVLASFIYSSFFLHPLAMPQFHHAPDAGLRITPYRLVRPLM